MLRLFILLFITANAFASDLAEIARDLEITDVSRNPYVDLAGWMAEAPEVPKALPDDQKKAFARAWATLWVNMQGPKGAWTHPIISPGANYMHGVWLWDSGFHIFGLRHGGPKARRLALWQIEVMLSGQATDGRIPREIWTTGAQYLGTHGIQAPGILTKAANDLLAAARDDGERAEVRKAMADFYPKLVRNHEWYAAHVASARGLSKWEGWDSGWDNSPRWDKCFHEAIDLNAWLYLDEQELARMADTLGVKHEWRARAEKFGALVRRHMWNETLGVFNDTLCDDSVTTLMTPAIYFPIWAGIATPAEARRGFAYLQSPKHFAAAFPLPSVALSEPTFWAEGYWRGPTWVNLNWVVYHALRRHGEVAAAEKIRQATLALVTKTKIPYEYYRAADGMPLGSKSYGWTASLFIDLAMATESYESGARPRD